MKCSMCSTYRFMIEREKSWSDRRNNTWFVFSGPRIIYKSGACHLRPVYTANKNRQQNIKGSEVIEAKETVDKSVLSLRPQLLCSFLLCLYNVLKNIAIGSSVQNQGVRPCVPSSVKLLTKSSDSNSVSLRGKGWR